MSIQLYTSRHLAFGLCFILVSILFCPKSDAYDPNFEQRVKYNQSRVKWKIKEGKERLNKSRQTGSSSYSSSYGSSSSRSHSQANSQSDRSKAYNQRKQASQALRSPSVAPSQALSTFISAANRATRLEQLYPYALTKTVEYWRRLDPKRKQAELKSLKAWTYHARILAEEKKPMVATVKMSGTKKGAHLWNEGGVWKYSDSF